MFAPETPDEDRAAILEGKKVETMTKMKLGGGKTTILEDEHRVSRFRRYLPAGAAGGNRRKPLVQFYAREGGMRTVAEGDIVAIR